MHALIIDQDGLDLPKETLEALWDELTRGGVHFGKLYVGSVRRSPDTIYLLWHLSSEIPVSITFPRKYLCHPMLVRIAAARFLMKWTKIVV